MPASWEKALDAAAGALKKAGAQGRRARRRRHDQRGGLPPRRGCSARASAPATSRRRRRARCPPDLSRALADPALQATVPDLEFAHAVLVLDCDPVDDAPILDLRLRKGVRRHGVRLAVAGARPGALDPNAAAVLRDRARRRRGAARRPSTPRCPATTATCGGAATAAGSSAQSVRDLAEFLTGAGEDVVILYGERLLTGPRGAADGAGAAQPRRAPRARRPRGRRAAGDPVRHERPRHPRGRLRARARPRLRRRARARGRPRRRRRASVLYLLHADPVRTHADRAYWEAGARRRADRHRPRVGARRRARGARRRRLPGRGLRREGGHADAPGRPRPAAAPRRSGAPARSTTASAPAGA